jgi:hypothetical protein
LQGSPCGNRGLANQHPPAAAATAVGAQNNSSTPTTHRAAPPAPPGSPQQPPLTYPRQPRADHHGNLPAVNTAPAGRPRRSDYKLRRQSHGTHSRSKLSRSEREVDPHRMHRQLKSLWRGRCFRHVHCGILAGGVLAEQRLTEHLQHILVRREVVDERCFAAGLSRAGKTQRGPGPRQAHPMSMTPLQITLSPTMFRGRQARVGNDLTYHETRYR